MGNKIILSYVQYFMIIILENIWGSNKISLNLLVPKHVVKNNTEIYLAGGCNQLGNWKSRLKMNKVSIEFLNEEQIVKIK